MQATSRTAVESFHEADRIARTDPPDLLITDIRLSGYNGLQLVLRFPELPAIVMTGFADPVLERDASQAGATYIRKPFERHRTPSHRQRQITRQDPGAPRPGQPSAVGDFPRRLQT